MLLYIDNMFPEWLLFSGHDLGGVFRPPPFERIIPEKVPHQTGTVGDCGVWVCIFLQRLLSGEPIYQENEDTSKTAAEFRWHFSKLCMKIKLELKVYDTELYYLEFSSN
ncbi:hypothetical protein R6Q59_011783 [Mikania micrantha]